MNLRRYLISNHEINSQFSTGVQPQCVLCPKKGGAMKSTRSGSSWAHVACALWVPEVSIGDPEKMEPITNISQIPSQRWGLLCSVCKCVFFNIKCPCRYMSMSYLNRFAFDIFMCLTLNSIPSIFRDKTGAPIQCSVKTCKTAFHVTCAFSQGFDMKAVVEESDDAVMLQ